MSLLEKNFLTLEDTRRERRSTWTAERSALAAEALRHSGHLHLRVHGESMLPALWPGDLVEIASCSLEDVRPGEIVLARREGRLFLHRLVGRFTDPGTPNGFLLRGDSMPGPDPQFPSEALLGRLVRRVDESVDDGRGIYAAPLRPGFHTNGFGVNVKLSRGLGMLLCYCGLARRLALKLHNHRKARAFRNPEPVADMSSADMGAR
jgi:Peptidase S24-like